MSLNAKNGKHQYEGWSKDRLIAELEKVSNEFGLRWDRRCADRDFESERLSNLVVMDHEPSYSAGTAPFQNLLIEGDNFDALRYLSVTHRGRIKCIYIDPPYNTGNNDFIYRDNFLEKDVSFRHSKWLAFMDARLQLAKELLTQDGVILVSIDDNEYHHLKMLMDQVFAGMYQATFVWKRRSGSNDAKGAFVSTDHEYVLCYAAKEFSFGGEKKSFENYTNPDSDPKGPWTRGDLSGNKPGGNIYYPVENPKTKVFFFPPRGRYWTCNPTKMGARVVLEKVLFPTDAAFVTYSSAVELIAAVKAETAPHGLRLDYHKTPDEVATFVDHLVGKKLGFGSPTYKRHLSEVRMTEKPLSTWVIPSSEKDKPESDEVEFLSWGYTSEGTKLVQEMLGKKEFNYPKPLSMVKALIEQATNPGDLVLDFFGGSATTGHAVLAINAEHCDDEPRQFIVVSSTEATAAAPEKNVCRDVSSNRLSAAVTGYRVRTKLGFKDFDALGGDFAYLRARTIPTEKAVLQLQDAQIWHALQLKLTGTFVPLSSKAPIQVVATRTGTIAYCPNPSKARPELARICAEHGSVLLFARKVSSKLRMELEHLGNVTCQSVPQEILEMFGVTE